MKRAITRQQVYRAALLGVVAGCVLLGYMIFVKRYWQVLQVDRAWCRAEAVAARDVIQALRSHKEKYGELPNCLADLVPEFLEGIPVPVRHPSGNGGDTWRYERCNGEYRLSVTIKHWVSSYDEFLFLSSQCYPNEVNSELFTDRMGSWLYLIGAQKIKW